MSESKARDTSKVVDDLAVGLGSKLPFVYSDTEPTTNLVGGFIWFDTNETPPAPNYYDDDAEEFVPFPSGAGDADFSDAATGTYTDDGIDYKYITYTASGTLTVTEAGLADVLVVGGGGGGSSFSARGGGAAEVHYVEEMFLNAGSYTVTVGGGGAGASVSAGNGNLSSLGSDIKAGRGGGSVAAGTGDPNIIGGGGSTGGLRNNSTDNNHTAGGGAGHDTWGGTNRYDGRSLSITGSAIIYGLGGHTGTAGTANRGNGGFNGGAGGSGVVVVRVKV
jgi:hypothetical protein